MMETALGKSTEMSDLHLGTFLLEIRFQVKDRMLLLLWT